MEVTSIINFHREDDYAECALKSLEAASIYAIERGCECNILMILDRPSEVVLEIAKRFEETSRVSSALVIVNNGSLGLSRNDGVVRASGRYVMLCDGDDLCSVNMIFDSWIEVKSYLEDKGRRVCCIPEYIYEFGKWVCLRKFYSSRFFNIRDFAVVHPFCSHLFIETEILRKNLFRDLSPTTGFAFEDWDLNVRLISSGVEVEVAKGTTLYYRKHDQSIMASSGYIRLPPKNPAMVPQAFWDNNYIRKAEPLPCAFVTKGRFNVFSKSLKQKEYFSLAAKIDERLASSSVWSERRTSVPLRNNLCNEGDLLKCLKVMVSLTGGVEYDEIILLENGDNAISLVNASNCAQEGRCIIRLVVYCGNSISSMSWRGSLPENVVVVNFSKVSKLLRISERNELLIRFILIISNAKSYLRVEPGALKEFMEIYWGTLSNAVCVTDFHEKYLVDRNAQGKKDLVNSRILSYLTDSGLYKKSERKSRQEIEKMVGRVENQLLMRSLPLRKKLKFLSRVLGVSK